MTTDRPDATGTDGASTPSRRRGSDQGTIRSLNRGVVLDVVKREGPISRARVAKRAALTKPTVSAIVDELTADGLLSALGVGEASPNGGRRPVLYAYNAASYSLLGVHIGVETTTVVLADGTGQELARREEATPRTAEAGLEVVAAHADGLLTSSTGALQAVGVAIPGLVDHGRGTCLLAPNLGWRNVPVVERLTAHLGVPVAVHNAAQAVLAAEHLEGAAQAFRNIVLLYEERGVGSAILSNGYLLHGARGIAGEIGHCKIPGGSRRCGCGRVGCLETELASPAILRRAREALGRRGVPRTLERLARRDEPDVRAFLRGIGHELGRALALLVNVINPEAVVVAAGFLAGGESLLDGLRAGLADDALPEALPGLTIIPSALGWAAPARGAVLLARHAAERADDPVFGTFGSAIAPSLS